MVFHVYGLLIGIAVLLALEIAKYFANGTSYKLDIEGAFYWMIIPAVIGARVYHVITDWHLYSNASLISIFAVWQGGLGIFGAIAGGIVGLFAYICLHQKKEERISFASYFFSLADFFIIGIPLGQAVGRFGNYFNKELYGLETSLPWGVFIDGKKYHPLFLYESILSFLLFLFLAFLMRTKKLRVGKGQYFALFLVGYGSIRFWLEFLRLETARGSGFWELFSIAQWVSLFLMVGGGFLFWVRRHALLEKYAKEWDFSFS